MLIHWSNNDLFYNEKIYTMTKAKRILFSKTAILINNILVLSFMMQPVAGSLYGVSVIEISNAKSSHFEDP